MRHSPLLDRLAQRTRAAYDADRRAHPDRFTGSANGLGPDLLFVENVARMLGCNVDFVRRIPRHALPASKVGARRIYSRPDVEAYVRSLRDAGAAPMRATHHRRATGCKLPEKAVVAFDPVRMIRQHMEGKDQ